MKAIPKLPNSPQSPHHGASHSNHSTRDGRVSRRKEVKKEEIQMYLSKLKELVPFMPRNRKLSRLEVIQNVISYICFLQNALKYHPEINNFDVRAVLAADENDDSEDSDVDLSDSDEDNLDSLRTGCRQPLLVLSDANKILQSASCEVTHIPIPEKLSPSDGRPVSV